MTSPQTCFYGGAATDAFSEVPDLELTEPASQLLFVLGFWTYCWDNVEVSNPVIFNVPWEGGYLSREELPAIERAGRRFSMQQPAEPDRMVTGLFARDADGKPIVTPAASAEERRRRLTPSRSSLPKRTMLERDCGCRRKGIGSGAGHRPHSRTLE